MTATKPGFAAESRTGITLVLGQIAEVDLTLNLGELKQVVTVEEQSPVVSVSTEQTSGLVGERQVKDLPLNGRSYDELMTLNPGIVNYSSERAGGVGTSNSAVGNMFAASGRRPQESSISVEWSGVHQRFRYQFNSWRRERTVAGCRCRPRIQCCYGHLWRPVWKTARAQVSVVTTSGTNQIHGSAYEFLRNSALDARNFFDRGSIPAFERNEFGAALGGPFKKTKPSCSAIMKVSASDWG